MRPGSVIGILGNGQLGRMLALAAARLGFRTHVYGPDADSPAEQVATTATVAPYDDQAALAAFADAVDAVTFEFENVPAEAAAFLAAHTTVRPSWRALEIAQDRTREKAFFAFLGAATAPWRPIDSLDDLMAALGEVPPPVILKTSRLGYDGKGQARIDRREGAAAAWAAIGGNAQPAGSAGAFATKPAGSAGAYAIIEGFIDFASEMSVIAARGADGTVVCFDPTENIHSNHILATSRVPAQVSTAAAATAVAIARRAVTELDLVGLLAVEMFVTDDGVVLCNEMAPRPHNSGHWTMDACGTDQFEMLVRAVAGLPLVDPARLADVTMVNLIGDEVNHIDGYLADPAAHVHLYGKAEAKPGRKMGHVNILRLPKSAG